MAVNTGGQLSTHMLKLVGSLDVKATAKDVKSSLKTIEKQMSNDSSKLRVYVELFGRVGDMKKDIRAIQAKINSSPQLKSVKLDVEFDFKGSASKIKNEMKEISDFVKQYSNQMKGTELIDLDKDAQNVKRNAGLIGNSINAIDQDTRSMGQKIQNEMQQATGATGKFAVSFRRDVNGAVTGANASITKADGAVEKFTYSLQDATGRLGVVSRETKELSASQLDLDRILKQVETSERKLNKARTASPSGLNDDLIKRAQGLLETARSLDTVTGNTEQAKKSMSEFNVIMAQIDSNVKTDKAQREFDELRLAVRQSIDEFARMGGSNSDLNRFEQSLDNTANLATEDLKRLKTDVLETANSFEDASRRMDLSMSRMQQQGMIKAVDERDIASLKTYVGELYDGEVASIRMTTAKNKLGDAIDRVKVDMQESTGVVKTYTLDMDRGFDNANRAIRQTSESTKELRGAMNNAGNGFGHILSQVTQYFSAIQVIQAGLRGIRATVSEILAIDAGMTELNRVADPSINTDVILKRSVELAKELGASVEDVIGSVGEMARTFGDFNEEQLLAITRTATMMDNVSDLTLEESTNSLVGTMNAFNISAEDSIRIVDGLNEVDNAYAISTQQLAQGMSRAGATAETFGVQFEELAGDITAIGSVTMESGKRIGTALRTIYSRITTIDGSKEVLESIGVSIYEMGESGAQIRNVSDILGDLSVKWNDLTAEQQQNIGVTIAGRNRLTQFLALMNNYDTAIDATTTAFNSQGSAMREQRAYMQSYEYQLKVLGASASDLALTVEDKLVGDALYLLITTGTDLTNMLNGLIDNFGLLGPTLGVTTTAFLLFNKSANETVTKHLKNLAISALDSIKNIRVLGTTTTTSAGAMQAGTVATAGLSTAIKGLLVSTGVGIAIAGLGFIIEKLVGQMAEARRVSEETKQMSQEAVEAYNAQGQDVGSLVDRYEELNAAMRNNADALSTEEQREYVDVVGQLQTIIPASVDYIDAQGQAHLRSADYIREQVGAVEELAKANAEMVTVNASEALEKEVQNMSSLTEELAEHQKDLANLNELSDESYEEYVKRAEYNYQHLSEAEKEFKLSREGFEESMANRANATAEAGANLANTQFAISSAIQGITGTLGGQSVAFLKAQGDMENISSAGETMIRNFASNNAEMIEGFSGSKEELNTLIDELAQKQKDFGDITRDVYDNIAENLNGVDTTQAIESFDLLVNALPTEFFRQSTADMRTSMEGLGSIISQVSSDADVDVNSLVATLENAGISSDIARTIVMNLGTELENQSIKTAVANEELAQYNDELVTTAEVAKEAVDPIEQLFGVLSDDVGIMNSHVANLQVLQQQYGDTWSEMDRAQPSIDTLADYFGQSEEFVRQNLDQIGKALNALSGASIEWNDELGKNQRVFADNVDENTKAFLLKMLESGDGFGGFAEEFSIDMGLVATSSEELGTMADTLNEKFSNFLNNPQDENQYEVLLGDLQSQLETLQGQFVVTEDASGRLKFSMADGTESEYFNNLNEQIENSGQQLSIVQDATGRFIVYMGEEGGEIRPITDLIDGAQDGELAIATLKESFQEFKNGTYDTDEEQQTFIDMLQNQVDLFGDGLTTIEDDAGNLKLVMADGSSSPWLDALNGQLDGSKTKLVEVTDELGNVGIELQSESGDVLFSSLKTGADNAKTAVDETKESIDKLDKKILGNGTGDGVVSARELGLQNSGALGMIDEVETAIDEVDNNEIDLSIDPDSIGSYNDVVKKLTGTKAELQTTQDKLDKMNADLRVTGENIDTIMQNASSINGVAGSAKTLYENIVLAKEELSKLYQLTGIEEVNVAGLSNISTTIGNQADSIRDSFNSMNQSIRSINVAMMEANTSFNPAPLNVYSNSVRGTSIIIANSFRGMVAQIYASLGMANQSYQANLTALVRYRSMAQVELSILAKKHADMSDSVVQITGIMSNQVHARYLTMSRNLVTESIRLHGILTNNTRVMGNKLEAETRSFSNAMTSAFRLNTNTMVDIAGDLPRRIGSAVMNNMDQASNSMTKLANSMVTRFKTALGIHSPSRVFEQLGGYVMQGLVNGLSDSNVTDLGQNVFSDFSDGAISTINEIKGYMTFEPSTAGSFGDGFRRSSGFGPRQSPGGIGSTNHRGVDYAAPAGTRISSQSSGTVVATGYNGARGNYVIVESGNMRYLYQHNSANHVREGQKIGKGDSIGTVGSTGASTGPHLHYEVHVNGVPVDPEKLKRGFRGFANGGFVDQKELAWHGEEGLEAIIPLVPQRRERGMDLWAQTGEKLGFSSEMLDLITRAQRKRGAYNSYAGMFGGLDGEAGEGEGGSTGTSGTIRPDMSSIIKTLSESEQPMFSPMDLEDLYVRDARASRMNRREAMVTLSNTELSALTKQTLKYRNALMEVNYQERRLRDETKAQLKYTQRRQKQIGKELSKLSNTGKHTEAQRKKYNALQEEFTKNSESIMSMENEIKKLNISMDERKIEIYSDYIGQLASGYDKLTESIDRTIANLEFSYEKLQLTDENNIGGQLDIQYDILRQSISLENTLMNSMNTMQKEYSSAVRKYGKDSERALIAREQLISAEDSYRASVLDRIKLEQEIEQTRKDIADESIDSLKEYYKQNQAMTEKAIELEKKALEESHDNKMAMYDDEIAKIESIYDARIQSMDDAKEEEAYEKEMNTLNKERLDLMNQISLASRDTSLEGRRRLAELQTELGAVNEEIQTSQTDRQDELYRAEIEKQKQAQIEALEIEKEREEKEQQMKLDALDKQASDAEKYANDMINNEQMWEQLRNDFANGDTNGLVAMMEEMMSGMSGYMSGDFANVSMGYNELSDEDKKLFNEDTMLEISNLMLKASESMERFVSTSNKEVEKIGNVSGGSYGTTYTNWGGSKLDTSSRMNPTITPPAPKPKPRPKKDNRSYTVKRGDTLWDLAQKYYGNPYKWTTIAQANENPDPRRLQIGRKLLIPFRSGGFTGDWTGDEGRMAILHKKELVLNEGQTRDILDVAKIVQNMSQMIPRFKASLPSVASQTNSGNGGETYNIDNLVLDIRDFKGSKKDAENAFDTMAKELKKRGKKF